MNNSFEESPEYKIEKERQRASLAEKRQEENSIAARGLLSDKEREIDEKEKEIQALHQLLTQKTDSLYSPRAISSECEEIRFLEWKPFPVDILPEVVRHFVHAHALAKNCDPAFIAAPALGVLAASIGNSYSIEIKESWHEISALWVMVIASSGSYKTPGMHAAVSPIYELERNAESSFRAELTDYEQLIEQSRLQKGKVNCETRKPLKPTRKRYVTGDATYESFVLIHSQNPRGVLVYRDELSGFVNSFDKYSGRGLSDMPAWIEMHGGKAVTIDRKTSEVPVIHVPYTNASIIGGIQPGMFRSSISPQFFNSGFVARLLMVMPPSRLKQWSEADVRQETHHKYHALVETLYAKQMLPEGKPQPLGMSSAAKKLWVEFYDQHAELTSRLPDGALRSAMTKLEFMAARFALILELADSRSEKPSAISEKAMANAIKLACWFRRETARIYLEMDFARSTLDKLQQLVLELPNFFRRQDLEKITGLQKSGAHKKINKMIEMKYIERFSQNLYFHRQVPELIDWSMFELDTH